MRKLDKATSKADGVKALAPLTSIHVLPGDAGWPLGGFLRAPRGPPEAEAVRAYLKQVKEALHARLLDAVFCDGPTAPPSKHWMQFTKRKLCVCVCVWGLGDAGCENVRASPPPPLPPHPA